MPYIKPGHRPEIDIIITSLAKTIARLANESGDATACAGLMNYALTRLLQQLPKEMVATGQLKEELRYWLQPLFYGVLHDVAAEHKRRVNTAYEAEQILKSGDCFDTPYYTKLIEVRDESGEVIGHMEVMLKREEGTVRQNMLDCHLVVKKK